MSHFYASINNHASKTEATRRGFASRGMTAHVRGWDIGVYVDVRHVDGKDVFTVYRSGGSNQPSLREKIAEVKS